MSADLLEFDLSGLGALQYRDDPKETQNAWSALEARFTSGEVGFFDAPNDERLSGREACISLAKKLRDHTYRDCLFIGIGGSSLGPMSALSALEHRRADPSIRFHFLENPDPIDWFQTTRNLDPKWTLVCVTTKSGETFETLALLQLALDWLGKPRWREQLIAITDPEKGDLRRFTHEQGLASLSIPPSVGGRFSVFSPVGLFPLALAGLDPRQFLEGAALVRDSIVSRQGDLPLFKMARALVGSSRSHPTHVCMPYSTSLRLFGDWWVQLWGESLGKDGRGFTPLAAVGAVDQHSLLQLLRDGPDDKLTFFIDVKGRGARAMIQGRPETSHLPAFQRLEGHDLGELLSIERRAIEKVLAGRRRPFIRLELSDLSEGSLGALYYSFSVLTALTGTLWNVDPFDQPGVEEGKQYIRQSLIGDLPY